MGVYSIITFGCQMNHSDSERIAAVLESMGYSENSKDDLSDIYVINTCSVRQKAEDRVFGLGEKFREIKNKKPDVKVILTGCLVKRDNRRDTQSKKKHLEKYQLSLRTKLPWVDIMVETNEIHKIPELLGHRSKINVEEYLSIKPKYNSKFQAFIPISTGCNKFCTFCIVPFTRGEEVYRKYEDIYKEFYHLIRSGYREICLLGQNVNSWKSSIEGHLKVPVPHLRKMEPSGDNYMDFADLMESLAQIEGDYWIRFTSSHPYDINPRLIDVIAKYPTISRQIHFALQSGSNSVLRRMNRYYTAQEFKQKIDLIREKIPNVAITTDVIVGFCGETEEEFQETVDLCQDIGFDQIYISEYSQRKGTIAAKFYRDDVPREEKKRRKKILEDVLKDGLNKINRSYLGTVQKVLIERLVRRKDRNLAIGKNSQGKQVEANVIDGTNITPGNFYHIRINSFKEFVLEGEFV